MSDHNNVAESQKVSEPQPIRPGAMKIARYNIILALLVFVQLGLAAVVFWPRAGSAAGGAPLLGDLTLDDITVMTITDNNERTVQVERGDDSWVLADSDGYPAKTEAITSTLTSLLDMTTARLVTRTPGSHNRLQVAEDNYLRRIDLSTTSGDITLYLGSSSGASATHVRKAGDDATYLTNEVATWELDTLASSWIDINYFDVNADAITALVLENANGRFELVKVDDQWTLADALDTETVAPANISSLVNRVAGINMSRPLGTDNVAEYGMDEPSAVITAQVNLEDGAQTITIMQGQLRESDELYPLKSSASPYYVLIAKFVGDEFATKTRSDFLIAPEEAQNDGSDASDADNPGDVDAQSDPAVNDGTEIAPSSEITPSAATTAQPDVTTTPDAEPAQ